MNTLGVRTSSSAAVSQTCSGRGRVCPGIVVFALIALVSASAMARTLTGTVTNGTTSKPVANAEVVLISLAQGMQEAGKTKTDSAGKFTLNAPDTGGPSLVRVSYQGVNYNKLAPPGTSTADVTVYDSAKRLDAIRVNVETAYQAESNRLQVVHFFTVKNASTPPRSVGGEQTFAFSLPEGAEIDAARAQGPGGQPLQQTPEPTGKKNEYAFNFPLRPGETVLQVGYHLPYSGELSTKPSVSYPLDQVAVILPASIKFEAKQENAWETPEHQGGVNLRVATAAEGKDLSYRISGTGMLPDQTQAADAQGGDATGGGQGRGPGGGLGKPIEAPDPLSRYRWPLLAMLGGLLALGALFMVSRRGGTPAPAASHGSALLNELKEELFQLEIDRRQGRISQEDYAKNKAALDTTIERALARAQKS